MFGRATIRLGIGPHSSFTSFLLNFCLDGLLVVMTITISEKRQDFQLTRGVAQSFCTAGLCPVSERLAKQNFSHWGFPVNSNEAEFFCLVA